MKRNIQHLLDDLSREGASPELLEKIHFWLLSEENPEEKESALYSIWQETEVAGDPYIRETLRTVMDKIEQQAIHEEQPDSRKIRLLSYVWRAAAVLLLLVASSLFTRLYVENRMDDTPMAECAVPAGELQTITLPDGTKTKLNSGSVLFYPTTFQRKTRTVHLIGEGVFEVHKNPDKPFIVKSSGIEVKALGTAFNVSIYPEDKNITTTLIEGKVEVSYPGSETSYILHPGEQIVYNKVTGSIERSMPEMDTVLGWTQGKLIFKDATLNDILTTMERRFAVTFQYNLARINKDKYNINFRSGTTLEEALTILNYLLPLSYTMDETGSVCRLTIKNK